MTDKGRFDSQRVRTLLGLAVVAASVLIAAALAGLGFAQGSPTALSAAANQYGKMTICHHTHSKKHEWVTITISQSAWPAHEKQGDKPGACPKTKSKHSNKGKHKGQHKSTPSHGK